MEARSAATLERAAAAAHDVWAHWMRYFIPKFCGWRIFGTVFFVVPRATVERWERQAETPYKLLLENEKWSDREVADRYIMPLIPRQRDR